MQFWQSRSCAPPSILRDASAPSDGEKAAAPVVPPTARCAMLPNVERAALAPPAEAKKAKNATDMCRKSTFDAKKFTFRLELRRNVLLLHR